MPVLSSLTWLEEEACNRDLHIHHAMCGLGGEWWITGAPEDGYEPTTKTVFRLYGCHWHGCPTCDGPEKREISYYTGPGVQNSGGWLVLVVLWKCDWKCRQAA